MTLLLQGEVEDPRDAQLDRSADEIRLLRAEVARSQREAQDARREASRALSALRRQLTPLYQALQAVFGELDAAGVEEGPLSSLATSADPRVSAVWASWKSRLGAAGKLIDALLLHGEMNTQQLAIATGLHRTTIPKHIYTLNRAGLLNKNGGRFSLKHL